MAEVKGDRVQLTPTLERAMTRQFLQEIRPMADSGKLGALLLQLTPSFSPRRDQLEELDGIIEAVAPHLLAVELRNRNWLAPEHLSDTTRFFEERQVTLVGVDAPAIEHFMAMPDLDVSSNPRLSYLRLHGRNAEGYVSGKTVAERFDYFYSDQEIKGTLERARQLAEKATKTHVVYNNNCADYPLRNAATFQSLLRQEHPAGNPAPPLPATDRPRSESTEPEFGFTADIPRTRPSSGRR